MFQNGIQALYLKYSAELHDHELLPFDGSGVRVRAS